MFLSVFLILFVFVVAVFDSGGSEVTCFPISPNLFMFAIINSVSFFANCC